MSKSASLKSLIAMAVFLSLPLQCVYAQQREEIKRQAETQLRQMTSDEIDAKIKELGMTRQEAEAKAKAVGIDLATYLQKVTASPLQVPALTLPVELTPQLQ